MSDYIFRILIVGDRGVGKSSLFWRFVEDRFDLNYYSPAVIEFKYCEVDVDGKRILLQICVTVGAEHFRDTLQRYYPSAQGVIIVYDTTSGSSFLSVSNWVKELGVYCSKSVNLMLVGTKCDELKKRQVPREEAVRLAEQHGFSFVEASAMTGANVKDVFKILAVELYKRLILKVEPLISMQFKMDKGQDQVDEDQGDGKGDGKDIGKDDGKGDVKDDVKDHGKGHGKDHGKDDNKDDAKAEDEGDSNGKGNVEDKGNIKDEGHGEGAEPGEDEGNGEGDGHGEGEGDDEGDGPGEGEGDGPGEGEGDGPGKGEGDGPGKGEGDGPGKGEGEGHGKGDDKSDIKGDGQGDGPGKGDVDVDGYRKAKAEEIGDGDAPVQDENTIRYMDHQTQTDEFF